MSTENLRQNRSINSSIEHVYETRSDVRTDQGPFERVFDGVSRHAGSNRCLKSGCDPRYRRGHGGQEGHGIARRPSRRDRAHPASAPGAASSATARPARLPAEHARDRRAVGLTSSSSVAHQLRVLEGKGFLRRTPTAPARSRCCCPTRCERKAVGPARRRVRRDRRRRRRPRRRLRPRGRADRRRRADPRRGAGRGGVPAAPAAGRRRHAVPARGQGRVDDRGRDLRRRLRRRPPAADRRERRDRRRDDRRRGDRQDLPAQGRQGLAAPPQPRFEPIDGTTRRSSARSSPSVPAEGARPRPARFARTSTSDSGQPAQRLADDRRIGRRPHRREAARRNVP